MVPGPGGCEQDCRNVVSKLQNVYMFPNVTKHDETHEACALCPHGTAHLLVSDIQRCTHKQITTLPNRPFVEIFVN